MTEPTPEGALGRLVAWLADEPGVTIDEAGVATVTGDPPLQISFDADDDKVTLSHQHVEEGAAAGRADAIIAAFPERGTSLQAAAVVDRSGATITLTNRVYLDGLSRHSFISAFEALVSAIDGLGSGTTAIVETLVHEPVAGDESEETAVTRAMEPVASPAGFAPTHRVPSGGMRAWDKPDPAKQPLTRLEADVELAITERRGDWANVEGSNGWTGWVDARRLREMGAGETADSKIAIGGLHLRPLLLVGAIALIGAAFLPWVARVGSTNSLDVPLSFLWDFTSSGDPQLGWVIIGLGVVALGLGVVRRPPKSALLAIGAIAAVISSVFVVQMYRGVTDFGGDVADLFDWLGFAPWVALGAGVVLMAGAVSERS